MFIQCTGQNWFAAAAASAVTGGAGSHALGTDNTPRALKNHGLQLVAIESLSATKNENNSLTSSFGVSEKMFSLELA